MAAATAAAVPAGHVIKFRKHAVDIFFIIVDSFNQFAPQAGKRIFLLPGNQFFKGQQAIVTYATVKSLGQKNAGFVADSDLSAIACTDIFPVTGECLFTPRAELLLAVHQNL
jgi:hypothetical protein